jgi:hypothetical protein
VGGGDARGEEGEEEKKAGHGGGGEATGWAGIFHRRRSVAFGTVWRRRADIAETTEVREVVVTF